MRRSPLRHLDAVFRRRPVHLTVFLTRRCNARCGFCFSRAAPGPVQAGGEIAPDELERAARSVAPLLWLAFSGGEIFLRDDLPELAARAARSGRAAIVLLPTNGLLPARVRAMTEEVLRGCPGSTVAVKVSIDGPPEVHDPLRGVPGAFAKAVETLGLLGDLAAREPRLEVGVNSVYCAATAAAMGGTVALVSRLPGVATHTVSLVRGELPDPSLGSVDPAGYLAVSELLAGGLRSGAQPRYRFRGARVKAAQDVLQRRLIHRALLERRQPLPCLAGRLNLVLSGDGTLHPCEDFRLRLGSAREHRWDLAATAAAPEARAVLDAIGRGECWCTHECFLMTGILFSPRTWPGLLRECLRLPGGGRRPPRPAAGSGPGSRGGS